MKANVQHIYELRQLVADLADSCAVMATLMRKHLEMSNAPAGILALANELREGIERIAALAAEEEPATSAGASAGSTDSKPV